MLTKLDVCERIYHTKDQAEYVANCISDDDYDARIRETKNNKYIVDVYETGTDILIRAFA